MGKAVEPVSRLQVRYQSTQRARYGEEGRGGVRSHPCLVLSPDEVHAQEVYYGPLLTTKLAGAPGVQVKTEITAARGVQKKNGYANIENLWTIAFEMDVTQEPIPLLDLTFCSDQAINQQIQKRFSPATMQTTWSVGFVCTLGLPSQDAGQQEDTGVLAHILPAWNVNRTAKLPCVVVASDPANASSRGIATVVPMVVMPDAWFADPNNVDVPTAKIVLAIEDQGGPAVARLAVLTLAMFSASYTGPNARLSEGHPSFSETHLSQELMNQILREMRDYYV